MFPNQKLKAASVSIFSNSFLIAAKLVVGFYTGSVSVLSEAVHSLNDLAAAVLAFLAIRKADRPADHNHPFGHGKFESVSGFLEGLLIFGAAGYIAYEAVHRALAGANVEAVPLGIAVMAVSIVLNLGVSRYLNRVAKRTDSLALEADAQHLWGDVYTSAGVLVALGIIHFTGFHMLDPLVALVLAAFLCKTAYGVSRKGLDGLLDTRLPEAEEQKIKEVLRNHSQQAVGFHSLRSRKSGSERFVDLSLIICRDLKVGEAHDICDHLEEHIKESLPKTQVIVHVEPCFDELGCPRGRTDCEVLGEYKRKRNLKLEKASNSSA